MTSLFLLAYFGSVLAVGLAYSSRRDRSTDDFFFAGRTTKPLALGSSLVLSNMLRYQIILLPLAAMDSLWVAVAASIAIVAVSYYSDRSGREGWSLSGARGGSGVRWYANGLMLLTYLTLQIGGLLVLANILLGDLLKLDYSSTVLMMIVFAGIYAVVGGSSAMVHAQAFQILVFGAGLFILAYLKAIPAPDVAARSLVTQNPVALGSAILGLPVMSLWLWHYDRFSSGQVRSSAQKNGAHRGLLVAGAIAVLIGGVVLVAESAPAGLTGSAADNVLLIVCIAVVMASFAPTFSGASELMANEFFRGIKPGATDRELVLVGRLTTAVVVGITILMIPFAQSLGSRLLDLFLIVQASLFPPLTAAYAARGFSRASVLDGLAPSLIAGELLGGLRIVLSTTVHDPDLLHPALSWLLSIDHYLFAFCLFCFTLVVLYGTGFVVSLRPKLVQRIT